MTAARPGPRPGALLGDAFTGVDWLRERTLRTPSRPALLCHGRTWTYASLDAAASAATRALWDRGVAPGDRVAVLAWNQPAVVVAIHAVARAGAALVPLNPRLTADDLAYQVERSRPRLILAGAALPDLAAGLAQRCAVPMAGLDAVASPDAAADAPPSPLHPADVHTVIFTSGTTGRPRGALLTFQNHFASAVASALNLGLLPEDRWLAALPLFHVGGQAIVLRGAIYGAPVILQETFDPAVANRLIEEDRVTVAPVVATMLDRMLTEHGQRPYPPWFRCALLGGGPAPRPLLEACAARGVPVVQTYGLSETASQVATLAPEDALRKLGAAGKPLWGTRVRIVRDGVGQPPGAAGEILVQGPTVMGGYLEDPEASAQALAGGWLHTGDIGHLDAEGDLYVLDRRDDLIISGGENIYPAELEAVLLSHPAVREAGVIGVPDPRWGQVPVAAVVLAEGAAVPTEALLAFAAERLARYKRLQDLRVVSALPRTAAGKLQRHQIRSLWAAASSGDAPSDGR